jgi:uncharacterized protein (DUF305 family)
MSVHGTWSRRRALFSVPVIGAALALTACGGSSSTVHASAMASPTASSPAASSPAAGVTASDGAAAGMSATYPAIAPGPAATGAHNTADVDFATGMIPHHGQAVQMADMVLARTTNAEVKALAERIKQAQTPEIIAMSGWLKGWGQEAPDPYATMSNDMAGMGSGGMMSGAQMQQLETASTASAGRVFLTLMPEHHQGAIDMARTELALGTNPEAKKLAHAIITGQSAEITQMKKMLATLS